MAISKHVKWRLVVFLIGAVLIVQTCMKVVPDLTPQAPQSSSAEFLQRVQRERDERMARDPAYRAYIEQKQAEAAARPSTPTPALPGYCVWPLRQTCMDFMAADKSLQRDFRGAWVLIGLSLFLWFVLVIRLFRPKLPVDHEVLGSAGFATMAELQAVQRAAQASGRGQVLLGRVKGKLQTLSTDRPVLLLAGAQGGHEAAYLLPAVLTAPGALVAVDRGGRLAMATTRARTQRGKVLVVDPWQQTNGAAGAQRGSLNPLAGLLQQGEDRLFAGAQAMAQALLSGTPESLGGTAGALEALLTALLAHVVTVPLSVCPGAAGRDLPALRALLRQDFSAPTTGVLAQMQANPACAGRIAGQAQTLADLPEEARASLLFAIRQQTRFLDDPQIAAALSGAEPTSGFGLVTSGQPASIYLVVPASLSPDALLWLRLMLTAAVDHLAPAGGTSGAPQLAQPVSLLVDGLGQLGALPAVERALEQPSGRTAVQLWACFQTIGEVQGIYQTRAASFWSAAGVRVAMAVQDPATADMLAKHMGTTTVMTTGQYISNSTEKMVGYSYDQQARALMTADEVSRTYARGSGRALVFLDGMHPLDVACVDSWHEPPFASQLDPLPVR